MVQPLKLRQLEHLALLGEELNFARAAARACLSQSAFSRSIQALENQLGLRLCDRDLKSVRLTPAGARIVQRARHLLSGSIDLTREIELLRQGDLGKVVCGAGPFTATALFPCAVGRLQQRHPEVDVRLRVDNWWSLLASLKDEELDFFISDIREIPPDDTLLIQPLGKLTGSLYCRPGHPLTTHERLTLSDLADARFASVYLPDPVCKGFAKLLGHADGMPFDAAFECENIVVARELVRRSDLVLLACIDAIRFEVESGYLVELRVDGLAGLDDATPLRTEIGIVRLRHRTLMPASELLLAQAIEVAPQFLV
jgi:DNA-binding transcriptional LysR family regulator